MKTLSRWMRWFGLIIGLSTCWAAADAERYLRHVRQLAAPEMKGRGAGTAELEKAARYIAQEFQAAGLQPLNGKSYFQPFALTTGATLGDKNVFEVRSGDHQQVLRAAQDFLPLSFSARSTASGAVVFAGYGITAPEYNYDDYTHLEVKGKIVLALRHEPQEANENSVFLGKSFTRHAEFINKAINARLHGAVALVVVNDRAAHAGEEDLLAKFGATMGPQDAGLPILQVKAAIADQWLTTTGKSLEQRQAEIDKTLQPQSAVLPETLRLNIGVDIERKLATVNNVAGIVPGATEEHLILGAHYDHLGLGEQHSLAPSLVGQIHPGADDNASGVAGLIELARLFAAPGPARQRGIVFLAFAGEELGLLGSGHYVNQPLLPLNKAVAMINLDMIGRVRGSKVFVGGMGTGSTFRFLIEEEAKKLSFQLDLSTGGLGSSGSDHTSFLSKQVPALFLFSGLHGDYHKPSDTWEKIDGPAAARLLEFVFEMAGKLAAAAERPQFVRGSEAPPAGASTGSVGGGYGPYFGSIPDFAERESGVKFADVREGSPAAKAGLKPGDILVEFDGKPVKNLYDFTYLLRSRKPGDRVEVAVRREGKPLRVEVTLEQRR